MSFVSKKGDIISAGYGGSALSVGSVSKMFNNGLKFELSYSPVDNSYRVSVKFPKELVVEEVAVGTHFAEQLSMIQQQSDSVSDCLLALAQAILKLEAANGNT